jgi:hypothetical protein
MSTEEQTNSNFLNQAENWLISDPQLSWWGRLLSIGVGVIFVLFSLLLGVGIDQSTSLVSLSGELISTVRVAFLGLGTGHYFGLSVKGEESAERWVLFGIFSTLAAITALFFDSITISGYPIWVLLILGTALSLVAHFSPLLKNNEEYQQYVHYFAGYLSTIVIAILAVSSFVLTLLTSIYEWILSFTGWNRVVVTLLLLFISLFGLVVIAQLMIHVNED